MKKTNVNATEKLEKIINGVQGKAIVNHQFKMANIKVLK